MTAHLVRALGGRRGRVERSDAEPRYRMIILDRLSVSFVFSRMEDEAPGWHTEKSCSPQESLRYRFS
jgi:hypothetical protein